MGLWYLLKVTDTQVEPGMTWGGASQGKRGMWQPESQVIIPQSLHGLPIHEITLSLENGMMYQKSIMDVLVLIFPKT